MQKAQKSRIKAQKENQAALVRSKPLQIRSGSDPPGPRCDARRRSDTVKICLYQIGKYMPFLRVNKRFQPLFLSRQYDYMQTVRNG